MNSDVKWILMVIP